MQTSSQSSRRGSTLVVALFVIAFMAVMIGVALDYTIHTAHMDRRGRNLTAAQALADGALEAAYISWQHYMANNQGQSFPPAAATSGFTTKADFDALTAPVLASLNAAAANSGFAVKKLVIRAVDQADVPHAVQSSSYQSTGPLQSTPGWIANSLSYRATAIVNWTGASAGDSLVTSVSRYFQTANSSLFQAMLFFQNDLELHPGPAMTLYGLVATNANPYLVAGIGGGLTFTSNVSYHGNPPPNPASTRPGNYYQSADGNYIEGVTQTLFNQEGQWGNYLNPTYASNRGTQLSQVQIIDPLGLGALKVDATNPNDTGTHEIIERPVPTAPGTPSTITADTTHTDPVSTHRLFNTAGLRILINRNAATNNGRIVHVYQQGANLADSVEIVPTGKNPNSGKANIADALIPAITPAPATSGFTDMREGRAINVNNVDISQITAVITQTQQPDSKIAPVPNEQVLYVSDVTSADANGQTGNSEAIRLIKGSQTPDGGLTVVSDGAVYVQGDYNTGGNTAFYNSQTNNILPAGQPNSNLTGDPTQDAVSGYDLTRHPSAVIGDAVMVLSNNWLDANSNQSLGSRVAVPTTFNAALVSGQVLTTASAASGGAHNFPRFLENWSGQNFSYHGSMCQLYASQHFTGTYGNGNVYSPPVRRWYFDDTFLTTSPPGNLQATNYVRGRWVRNQLNGNELQ